MNRQAIALAADSATTVTEWVGNQQQQRFFKGANKIFQISNHHPVGLMVFGAATLHEVPWELIVKEFRKHLGEKSFNDLDGYAQELFGFMTNHSRLFPLDYPHRGSGQDSLRQLDLRGVVSPRMAAESPNRFPTRR